MKSLHQLAFALFVASTPPASAQGTATLFDQNAYQWLPIVRRMELPADMNGDGIPEIVGWWGPTTVAGYLDFFIWSRDSEMGTWIERRHQFHGGASSDHGGGSATAVGDIDGNGKDEVVLITRESIRIFKALPNGDPALVSTHSFPTSLPATFRQATLHDFNGDGRDDLAFVTDGTLYLFRSTGVQLLPADTFETTGGDLSIACADADGDSALEIVVLQERVTPRVHVFPVNNMTLGPPTVYTLEPGAGGQPSDRIMLTSGDVDGDGDTDLALFGAGAMYQILRRGPLGFSVEAPLPGGPATQLADINGDGNLDGICCGGGGGDVHNDQPSTFELCLGDGTGSFDSSVAFQGLGAHHVAGAMDFDLDGDTDVIAGRVVLLNRSEVSGTFCAGTANSTGLPALLSVTGTHSKAAGGIHASASGLPPSSVALLVGSNLVDGADVIQQPFWNGTLCLAPPLGRLGIGQSDAGGMVDFGGINDWNSTPGSVGISAEMNHGYQVWYRDSAAGPGQANISGACHALVVD